MAAIQAEWTRTGRSYARRVADLTNGGGLNGHFKLTAATVFDDGAKDRLAGGDGLDWFFVE